MISKNTKKIIIIYILGAVILSANILGQILPKIFVETPCNNLKSIEIKDK